MNATTHIQFRVTPERKQVYQGAALEAKIKLSEWIMRALDAQVSGAVKRVTAPCELCGQPNDLGYETCAVCVEHMREQEAIDLTRLGEWKAEDDAVRSRKLRLPCCGGLILASAPVVGWAIECVKCGATLDLKEVSRYFLENP